MTDGTPISGLGPHGRRQQEIIAIQGSANGRFQPEQRTGAGEPMDQAVNPDERDSSVVAVAAVSLAAGLACTLAPAATARLAGIDANPGVVRAVGLMDLALARGLYVARPSWPWRLARPASNPAIAAVSLASARSRRARPLAAGLAVATASDVRTAARLRAARR
jgi:hypothetical protein